MITCLTRDPDVPNRAGNTPCFQVFLFVFFPLPSSTCFSRVESTSFSYQVRFITSQELKENKERQPIIFRYVYGTTKKKN